MKIALIGYGKMGHIIEGILKEKNHEIVARIDPFNNEADSRQITKESLKDAEVCIDFTHPDTAVDNIKKISALRKNLVVGTTGWYDKIDDVKKIIQDSGIGFIYASNFSLGVNVFFKMIENSAKIIDKFDSYDISGIEYHHNRKADSPSGTAKTIAGILVENIARKKEINYDRICRKIKPEEVHIASVRCGAIPGTHKVLFDSNADTIELSHTARSREGFARGAVLAAEWIKGKKGFYSIHDLMKDII
ncbi:4-hydroxy-tetrahydrodipicolinate reductase [Candidatus Woesearchaeota archaeon]|nr:4-hydroxy-tetrahydrodipicolinate reductase [Candidatus Woesearchaeota archaeon]